MMKVNGEKTIRVLLLILYVFSLVYALNTYLELDNVFVATALFSVLFAVFFSYAFSNKLSKFISLISIIISAVIFGVYIGVYSDVSLMKNNINSFINLSYKLIFSWEEGLELSMAFKLVFTAFLCMLISFIGYIFIVKWFNFYISALLGMLVFIFQWSQSEESNTLSYIIFIFTVFMLYIFSVYITKRRRDGWELNNILYLFFGAAPIVIVTIILSLNITTPDIPIQWPWLDEKVNSLFYNLEEQYGKSRYEFYSIKATGFGDKKELGGKVKLDSTKILEVKADKTEYLRGRAYKEFTGKNWTSPENEYINNDNRFLLNTYEIEVGVPIFSMKNEIYEENEILLYNQERVFAGKQASEMEIVFKNVRTKTLFAPLGLSSSIALLGNVFMDEDDIAYTEKSNRKGFSYSLKYHKIDTNDKNHLQYLKLSKKDLYKEELERLLIGEVYGTKDNAGLITITEHPVGQEILDVYSKRAEDIYNEYTMLPDSLSEKVYIFASDITKNMESDYDKVKAIEEYLSDNYLYTLNPPKKPIDSDFTEYFLFESKQGYCTYYATAMCVLARAIGMPARYVEGYILPAKKDNDGYYQVNNRNAHAWPEVYFEGVGWISFEPTSPFKGARYTNVSFNSNSISDYDEDYYMQMYLDEIGEYYDIEDLVIETESIEEQGERVNIIFVLIIIPIIILANMIRVFVGMILLKILMPKKAIFKIYKIYLLQFSKMGYKIKEGETLREYAKRIDDMMRFSTVSFSYITETYSRYRFGTEEPCKNDVKVFMMFLKEIYQKTVREMGIFKYFIMKYIIPLM